MLYVSTRSRTDSFTSYRALHEDRTPDGGMFVPMRMPVLTNNEIRSLKDNSIGETVAFILNLFFSANLTGWDVDFLIGRHPFRLTAMNHRLMVGELWNNLDSDYSYTERNLYNKLSGTFTEQPTDWAKIAIRIAVLFGLYGELLKKDYSYADIAVPAGDFSTPMAAWYARQMGLPVGTIICGCNENGAAWDLIHRGELNTNLQIIHTETPSLDESRPESIERLIYGVFGLKETQRYLDVCAKQGTYVLQSEELQLLAKGLFSAVVSSRRVRSVISSMYQTNRYFVDGNAAVALGSLQDYRARTGESHPTLLLADNNPRQSNELTSKVLGMPKNELMK